MFAPILAFLSSTALANAYGLKSASTSPYGQSVGNWELQRTAYGALLVGGKDVPLTTSVIIEGGQLKLVCPQQATAALVPTGADNLKYTVQFVSKTDDLPEGSIFTGWTTQDDGVAVSADLTKVVNTEVGLDGAYNLATVDGANALTWSSKGPSNGVQWFLAIDEANDVHC
ncbi:hypothetical protein FB107DRAFT_291135 [Schizophyllum commune]